MAIEDQLLQGEEIAFESKKHWIAPVRDSLIAILLLVAAYALNWLSPDSNDGIVGAFGNLLDLIRTGLVIVAIGWIVYNVVLWRTARFAISNLRVLREEGLISKRQSATMLASVTDVKSRVGFLGNQLGYGDLVIFGQSGDAGADRFESITAPTKFRDEILNRKLGDHLSAQAAVQALAGGTAGGAAAAPASVPAPAPAPAAAAPAAPDPMATLAELAKLRDAGAITPEEYEAKKVEILGRI